MRKVFLPLLALVLLVFANASAQEEYFGKNKVQYKSFNWTYIQSPNFDVYFYDNQYDLAKFAIAELETAYVEVSRELDYRLKGRIPVFIYNSPNEFQQTNVVSEILPEGVGGFTEYFKNRVVVPYNGSYEDLRHVLHHELTHAVIVDLIYGNVLGSLLSRQYLFQLPLWFGEGYAEYSSRGGWDYFADMIVRDATIHGYLAPVDYLGGYLAYKEGQAAIKFLAETYGEEKISDIINKGRRSLSISRAMKASIGLTTTEFDEKFQLYLKKVYWPEIATRDEPAKFAKRLTNHEKDGSYFNEKPTFSPNGELIAFYSDRSDYTEIYLMNAGDGKVVRSLVKGERSGDLESLHSFVSGLAWSFDGKFITFAAKSDGKDALMIYSVDKKKIVKRISPGFGSIYNPVFTADSNIIFTGVTNGRSDLYHVDVNSKALRKLTDDEFDDKDAAINHDGTKLAFASDRLLSADDSPRFRFGNYNIFIMDLATGAIVDTVTREAGICRYPTWSPDGKKLCYVSNLNGIDNLYVKDFESGVPAFPITNVLSGISSPSWSPKGDQIVFQAFFKGGYDVYLMKDIKPVTDNGAPLVATKFAKGELRAEFAATLDNGVDSATVRDSLFENEFPTESENTDFVFTPPTKKESDIRIEGDSAIVETAHDDDGRDTVYAVRPDGEFEVKRYKAKFSPDIVSGGLSYDTFYGLRGQSFVLVTDFLGNHQFLIGTDIVNSINQSNLQLYYINSTHRTDFGFGVFHNKNYFQDNRDRLFSDRTYGLLASVSHPFSLFRRVQLDVSHIYIDRTYYDPRFEDGKLIYDDANEDATTADLAVIHDNVLWGYTGPVNGSRWKLSLERTLPLSNNSQDYWAGEFDYRKYFHLGGQYSFAFRMAGGASFGSNKKVYYVGGNTNYIGSTTATDDVYSVQGFYFSKIITPLRGYDYFEFQGTKYGVVNLEFRYPFVEYLALRFPLPIVLARLSGAAFFDAGAAWNRNEEFRLGTTTGANRLLGLKTGFGTGARVNLGIFLLRYDLAWGWDLVQVTNPKHYFSFGAEF